MKTAKESSQHTLFLVLKGSSFTTVLRTSGLYPAILLFRVDWFTSPSSQCRVEFPRLPSVEERCRWKARDTPHRHKEQRDRDGGDSLVLWFWTVDWPWVVAGLLIHSCIETGVLLGRQWLGCKVWLLAILSWTVNVVKGYFSGKQRFFYMVAVCCEMLCISFCHIMVI